MASLFAFPMLRVEGGRSGELRDWQRLCDISGMVPWPPNSSYCFSTEKAPEFPEPQVGTQSPATKAEGPVLCLTSCVA